MASDHHELQPPANISTLKLSFPEPHILLVSFNRPKAFNVFTEQMEAEMGRVMKWFDDEPNLWQAHYRGNIYRFNGPILS